MNQMLARTFPTIIVAILMFSGNFALADYYRFEQVVENIHEMAESQLKAERADRNYLLSLATATRHLAVAREAAPSRVEIETLVDKVGHIIHSDFDARTRFVAQNAAQLNEKAVKAELRPLVQAYTRTTLDLTTEGRAPFLKESALRQFEVAKMLRLALMKIDAGKDAVALIEDAHAHLGIIEKLRERSEPLGLGHQISQFEDAYSELQRSLVIAGKCERILGEVTVVASPLVN